MLILSRKIGERVRVTTPCNRKIWLEQADGHVLVDSDGLPVHVKPDGSLMVIMPSGERIKVQHTVKSVRAYTREPMDRAGIGITAPFEYAILREELIGTEGRR